jgi:alkyl hydroperoxide reductase subunit AhpF
MPPKLLNDEISEQIKNLFDAHLVNPVELIYFSKKVDCDVCEATQQLLSELVSISDKLSLSEKTLEDNQELAQKYQVSLAPSLIVAGWKNDERLDFGIRFIGIPSGYEFSSLIQAIRMVSLHDSGLNPASRNELAQITAPVHLQVFVTPT